MNLNTLLLLWVAIVLGLALDENTDKQDEIIKAQEKILDSPLICTPYYGNESTVIKCSFEE